MGICQSHSVYNKIKLNNFVIVEEINDDVFGRIRILRKKDHSKMIFEKTIILNSKAQKLRCIHEIRKRFYLKH